MKHTIEDFQKIGKKLKERLELETEIISIKFIKKVSQIPDGFLRPFNDTGNKMTLCMAMAAARYENKKVAITADDNPCTPVSIAQGWAKAPMLPLLKSQVVNKWNKDILSVIRLNNSRYRLGGLGAQWPLSRFIGHKGFMVSPLSQTPFVPDTVVLYGYPLQITHVAQAFSVEGKYVPRGVAAGFGESCWAAGLFPLKSKNPVFILGGFGERVFAQVKNYEVAMGMPGVMAFYVDEYLYTAGGGEHNLLKMLQNPPREVSENVFPGWHDVRNIMKY
jgi:uncharacterized protein (DUF169 family)